MGLRPERWYWAGGVDPDHPAGIAVSPDGKYVYIAMSDFHQILRLSSTNCGTFVDSDNPMAYWDVTLSQDGKKLYATDYRKGTVCIFRTDKPYYFPTPALATFNIGGGCNRVTLSLNGEKVFVTDRNCVTVGIINVKTDKLLDTTNIPEYPSVHH